LNTKTTRDVVFNKFSEFLPARGLQPLKEELEVG
jgi:hypothetical protein